MQESNAGPEVAALLQVLQPELPAFPSKHLKQRADCSLLTPGEEHKLQTCRFSGVVLSAVRQSTHCASSALLLLWA
jgi:hypothetical protein